DNYFQYDNQHRVTEEVAQGLGCTICTGGLGTFTYSYTTSTNTNDTNRWKVKTVETLPDGSRNTVYTNFAGEVMLRDFHDVAGGQDWIDFWRYNGSGQTILHAQPSAVTGYDETSADLVRAAGGNSPYLADHAGLVVLTSYVPGGTDGAGYPAQSSLRQG